MIKKRKRALPFLPTGLVKDDLFEKLWDKSWVYVKTVINAKEEPVLILDKEQLVVVANTSFYQTFQVKKEATEGVPLHHLGNGQWNSPSLHSLLKEIFAADTSFKGFEVTHTFPYIGEKIMLLSARKMYYQKDLETEGFLPVILLAFEDITDLVTVAESFAKQLSLQHQND